MQSRRGVALLLGALAAVAGTNTVSPVGGTPSAAVQQVMAGQQAPTGPQQASTVRAGQNINLTFLRSRNGLSYRHANLIWLGREKRGNRRGRSRFNYNR